MLEKNPRELFQEKPTQSDRYWKPNPHSAPGGVWTGVLEVVGKSNKHDKSYCWNKQTNKQTTLLYTVTDHNDLC